MKYCLSFAVILIFITGCNDASKDISIAKKMIKPLINAQCGQELDQSKLWNVSTYLMKASNKSQLHKEVCACVAQHALTDIPSQDLMRAMIDEDLKHQLIQKAVLNSAKACILKIKPSSKDE